VRFDTPLIFEAAFELRWEARRRNLAVVVVLATVGVLLSALVTGAVMAGLAHWPMSVSLLFGILIAATDPVSVLAIAGRTDDHLIEVALTTVAAYGSFLLAERFGGSGILAGRARNGTSPAEVLYSC
jgi:NhaP-type Na+/H+ or K+/H+ antiporter